MKTNLKCTVASCMHHKNSNCCLETIDVYKTAPSNQVNAKCVSYTGKSPTNFRDDTPANPSLNVNCNAQNCRYNTVNICSKNNVTISLTLNDAECIDFTSI